MPVWVLLVEAIVAVIDKLLAPILIPFEILDRISIYLWGDGDWKLRPLHQQVVDRLLSHLDPEISEKVRLQLQRRYFIQFIPHGRINSIFFNNIPESLLISDPALSNALFNIEMFVDGRKQQVKVTFSKGQIFTIEFKKPHKFYEGKEIRFGAVTLGKPSQDYASVIDRYEHGREADKNL